MYKNGDECPICGDGLLKEKKIRETFEYKGNHLTIDDYVVYECSECDEALVDPNILKDTEKTIRDFQRKTDRLLMPQEIKEIRKVLGFTQEKFASILGGGVKSFARYESGIVTQSRAMDNLLRIIKTYPKTLEVLTDTSLHSHFSEHC